MTTSVDTGALDTTTDELVAKNSGADSETPQHDPEPEPEDKGGEQEQLQLPGKVVDKLSPGATTSTRVDTPRVTEGKLILTLFIPMKFSIKLHTIKSGWSLLILKGQRISLRILISRRQYWVYIQVLQ